jgi:hypothetical protein
MVKSIVLAFGLTTFSLLKASAYENGDFQIWNTNGEEVAIHKSAKFVMEQEFRYGNNAKEIFYQHYDFGVVYGFDKMLDIGLFYRQIYEWYKSKYWRPENMPNANATIKLDIWKFKLEDRNRLEYRHFDFAPDQVRYRNRAAIKFPFQFKTLVIAPYTSDEIFVSSNGTGFNHNRFQSGLEVGLTKYVKADISYMLASSRIKGDKWSNANVLWLKARIAF